MEAPPFIKEGFGEDLKEIRKIKGKPTMPPMTHNYMLGLVALVVSFVLTFYLPIAYFWMKAHKARKQNK
ncbi:hypothetical protein [Acinetobacter thermotolerans]|uniref:hypothetical protein n=1 Tax=Acinetobacter thermotolerans TaxID=3151487 RepID=UPI00325A5164